MKNQKIRLTESQLNTLIQESIRKVLKEELNEYQPSKRSIQWNKLISNIKSQINTSYDFAQNNPGLYTLQRMRSFMDPAEPGYKWSSPDLSDKMKSIISNFDIRNIDDLMDFCDKLHLSYPKWIKRGVTAELTDDGWVLFEK